MDGIKMHKRLLKMKACGSSDEPYECNGIYEQAQLGALSF